VTTAISTAQTIAGFNRDLTTERLVMRLLALTDAAALYAHFNDWEVIRWLSTPIWPQEAADMDRYLRSCLEEQANGRVLALTVTVSAEPIGLVSWDCGAGSSHLGYWLGRSHWGNGYMGEAAAAFCDWIFASTPENAVFSGVFDGNVASLRLQQRLGFIEVGRSVHYSTPRGTDLTHIDTKLTRTARRVVLRKAVP
jgi:RimJ/RimL family protein N-acetyltransferase